jgi:hypothetical protein
VAPPNFALELARAPFLGTEKVNGLASRRLRLAPSEALISSRGGHRAAERQAYEAALQLRVIALARLNEKFTSIIHAMKIEFDDQYRWHVNWVTFPALVDGRAVENRVTRIVLDDRFGAVANQHSEEAVYVLNREAIREIARRMFAANDLEEDGSVVITSDAIIRYDPTLIR